MDALRNRARRTAFLRGVVSCTVVLRWMRNTERRSWMLTASKADFVRAWFKSMVEKFTVE